MVIDGRVGLPGGLARRLAAGLDGEVSVERQTRSMTPLLGGRPSRIAAELAARGVDLSDHEAIDGAVRALNAERLARYLIGE